MKYLVQIKQNLTACDTIFRGNSTCRVLREQLFETEDAAIAFYQMQKSANRFAGLAGQYVTFPVEVDDEHKIFEVWCDECGKGIELSEPPEDDPKSEIHLGFTDLPNGNFCSRSCFRNSFSRERNSYGEDECCGEPYSDDE